MMKPVEEKLRDASKMYEKLFMREMMKSMRSTVQESGFIKTNAAEKMFREELDSEYVNSWSDRGGVGFADLIYDNLMEKFGVQLGLKDAVTKPKGPLPLDAKSEFTGLNRVPSREGKNEITYRFDRKAAADGPLAPVHAPWSGLLTGKTELPDGSHVLDFRHDNGLKGQLVFRGSADRLVLGQPVQEGERIGLLSPEAKSFFWTLGAEPQTVSE
ncbi:MAG: rod-binding protein [Bdellovibrionaceae bacterium]|nr:rod-binding protein [Pseudobdellovibrionaceae bacterium]